MLLGNGTNYVDSASIPYSIITGVPGAPFAGTGVPWATSTTASTVATSTQIVGVLNTAPSTQLVPALLPIATTSAFGAVKPDNTTIAVSAGIMSVLPATPTQSNKFGTYFSGVTYTNGSKTAIEQVGITATGGGGCVGNDSDITFIVNGIQGYGNGIYNQCNGQAGVTFTVPPGGTFSATATHIDGSGSTVAITSWVEII